MNGSIPVPVLAPAAAEIVLAAAACVVLVVEVYARATDLTYRLTQAALVLTALVLLLNFPEEPLVILSGTFVADPMAAILKLATLVIGWFLFFYMQAHLRARGGARGEHFILGLFALLGMMVLVSAADLLTVYLGLELLSLSLYAMVALERDSPAAAEAAMKYFVLGALASGMLLYGMSMVYGATGTLELARIGGSARDGSDLVLVLGVVFVVTGLGFKLGAAPFHMWIPDVYEGSQTPVTMFVGTAPKLAAFAMAVRLLGEGLGGVHAEWQDMLVVLAVASIGLGNVVAIAQSNLKRMLAYSTIAHMGYLLLGIVPGTNEGYAAAMFYVIVYAVMALGAFGMIVVLAREGFEADRLDDFRGLNERSPWHAFLMMVLMLSMAGVPPFVGFWAKWSVLREIVDAGLVWLAVVAAVFSVVGLFYYLRLVKLMYFDEPDEGALVVANPLRIVISVNALAVLLVGLFPGALLGWCLAALTGGG